MHRRRRSLCRREPGAGGTFSAAIGRRRGGAGGPGPVMARSPSSFSDGRPAGVASRLAERGSEECRRSDRIPRQDGDGGGGQDLLPDTD